MSNFDYEIAPDDCALSALMYYLSQTPSIDYNTDMHVAFKIIAVCQNLPDSGYQIWLNWRNKTATNSNSAEYKGFIKKAGENGNINETRVILMCQAKNLGWDDRQWRNSNETINDNYQKNVNNKNAERNKELISLKNELNRIENLIIKYQQQLDFFNSIQKQLFYFNQENSNYREHFYTNSKKIDLSLFPKIKISLDYAELPDEKKSKNNYFYKNKNGEKVKDLTLKIPFYDIYSYDVENPNQSLCNLQKINYKDLADKSQGFKKKWLKKPALKNGTGFFLNSPLNENNKVKDIIFIGEGFATMASIYQILEKKERENYCLIMAGDAGNLVNVGMAIRLKYPNTKIIFCADNDYKIEHLQINAGIDACKKAIKDIDSNIEDYHIIIPPVLNNKPTDWNDLYLHNKDLTRQYFFNQLEKINQIEQEQQKNFSESMKKMGLPDFYNFTEKEQIEQLKNSEKYKKLYEKFYEKIIEPKNEIDEWKKLSQDDFEEIPQKIKKLENEYKNIKNKINNILSLINSNNNYNNKSKITSKSEFTGISIEDAF